jgi:NAD(P)-dependent dehydrogenase (short-subunit alcohol dehydrogenase family)
MATALITGGSRGFGRALAQELARRGWSLVIDGREPDTLQRAGDAIGGNVVAIAGDITDRAHRRRLIDAVDRFEGLELLVNNASSLGATPLPGLDRYPLDELRRVFEVNVIAPLALTQALLTNLTPVSGVIVNVTSDAAVEAYEGWGGYGSSKAALDQISNVMATERPELRVYAFDPGDMRTDMHQAAFPGEDISDRPEPHEVVPSLLRLLDESPRSGRYRASDLKGVVEVAS